MKVISYQTWIKHNKLYFKNSPILNLDRQGYHRVYEEEYDKGESLKPKVIAKQISDLHQRDVVYAMTTHAWHQPYIEVYISDEN